MEVTTLFKSLINQLINPEDEFPISVNNPAILSPKFEMMPPVVLEIPSIAPATPSILPNEIR